MGRLAAFSELVEHIYDAAWEASLWPRIPEEVAQLHGGSLAMLFAVRVPGVEDGFQFVHGVSPGALEAWSNGIARDDVWVKGGIERGLFRSGNVVRGEDLVFLGSAFYRTFLRPQDCRYLLSGVLFDGRSDGLPMSVCSVMRGHAGTSFDDENVQLHRLVTNHLSRAMATMWRLRSSELEMAASHAALDRVASAVLLIGTGGKVVFCNRAARVILERADGVRLAAAPHEDRVRFDDPASQKGFDRLVRAAMTRGEPNADHFCSGLRLKRPSRRPDYVIQVAPLGSAHRFAGEAHAIVFITDPHEGARLDGEMFARLYSMTRAEVRLAEALAAGNSLAQAAASLGIRPSTARTHLRVIFEKTGTSRQAQLMKLLVSLRVPP